VLTDKVRKTRDSADYELRGLLVQKPGGISPANGLLLLSNLAQKESEKTDVESQPGSNRLIRPAGVILESQPSERTLSAQEML